MPVPYDVSVSKTVGKFNVAEKYLFSHDNRLSQTKDALDLAIMVPQLTDVHFAVKDIEKSVESLTGLARIFK